MHNFIANYSENLTKDINERLFDRTKDRSIADYVIDGIKIIESLPYITFVSYEHITDCSKIDTKLNRRHIKSKAILKDKDISKIVSIRDTAQEMLILKFKIDFDGETKYVTKELLIPSYINKYHLLINGKAILPLLQMVDCSTYSQKKSLKLKTILTPIDIYREDKNLKDSNGEPHPVKTFILNLFTKEIDPLYYYFAKFGPRKTIKYFGFDNVIDLTAETYNTDINYYFPCGKDIYIEVDKRWFNENDFIRSFTHMIWSVFDKTFTSRNVFEEIDDIDFWIVTLGAIYTSNTKNQHAKGLNVKISFERILDDITKRSLRLNKQHMQSTYSLLRWMLENFIELRTKDTHDLLNKRIRCNEVIAFCFIQAMAYRINSVLNKKKLTIESIEKIFNWNSDELIKNMISSKNSLLKYDPDLNDFNLLQALRYSVTGAQGISGGKNISTEFRDIYASHVGRVDLNGISHGKNTALSGYLVPMCKIYGEGFFSKESTDPDNYSDYIKYLRSKFKDPNIDKIKADICALKDIRLSSVDKFLKTKTFVIEEGMLVMHRIKAPYKVLVDGTDNMAVIASRKPNDPMYRRTYRDDKGVLRGDDDLAIISRRRALSNDGVNFIIKSRLSRLNKATNNTLIEEEQ